MSQDPRIYGHIPNVPVFTTFRSRDALIRAGVHGQSQAGIHGDSKDGGGAFSICVSGGYEDNVDNGETIVYVGSGGQNSRGEQTADQSFDDSRNRSLQISCETARPVRVIRGRNKKSFYAAGLRVRHVLVLMVVQGFMPEMRRGKEGHNMCFFELQRVREEGDKDLPNRRRLDYSQIG
ncbi:PUA-like domain-containing protein [Boletus edulis]|nr:PUA-like domain-containing protein [Boletus edulis]